MKNRIISSPIFLLLLLVSCREPAPQIPANKLSENSITENMMALNREFAELENEEINHYIDSLNLNMSQTATGLRYRIIKEGNGKFPQKGDEITFRYTIHLLNNVECEKLKDVVKTIKMGKGAIENGLEEAISLLKVSGKGEFVIPSHLAFGVSGYENCVTAWTPVFCEINLIENKTNP